MRWPEPTDSPLPPSTDVLIIGQSAAGYGCAHALSAAGIDFALVADGESKPEDDAPAAFIGGLVDNITRVHHTYGDDVTRQVWQFSQDAAASFAAQLSAWQVPWQNMAKLRLHHSAHQQTEGLEAAGLLGAFTLGSSIEAVAANRWACMAQGPLVHNEDGQGYTFDADALSATLTTKFPCHRGSFTEPSQLATSPEGFRATTTCGQSIAATMVVIACQRTLIQLRPFYRDVLIPYGDQWQQHDVTALDLGSGEDALFYADHGYVYGYHLAEQNRLLLAGGRFAEKGARIGDASGRVSAKVEELLTKRGGELFGQPLPPPLKVQGFCDTRTCDELPVIGPDFREPQLLVAGGFMGGGAGIAWQSGVLLAELIATGGCPSLPRALWPTRLRSL